MIISPLDNLIKQLARLPGLGPRSARRIALTLLTEKEQRMRPLREALQTAEKEINNCDLCGNLDTVSPCRICQDSKRTQSQICIVAGVADLWAIERTHIYKGLYHVLGGVLSAMDGIGPQDLRISSLLQRIHDGEITEIIMALGATVDGQATIHYLSDRLADTDIKITRLAQGVPIGGELDYLDDGTIATALRSRSQR